MLSSSLLRGQELKKMVLTLTSFFTINQSVQFGEVIKSVRFFFAQCLNFSDGLIPFDGMPTVMLVHTHLALAVVIYILAAAGVVFAIVCLVFNFAFRQRK